jgi:hypothetical protein
MGLTPKRLYHFCPTYDMFSDNRKDHNWRKYRERYKDHLRHNKDKIIQWINSLENKVYILCCWEKTTEGKEGCHRKIIFDAFSNSAMLKDKVVFLYRHGNEIKETIPTSLKYINQDVLAMQTPPAIAENEQLQNDQNSNQNITYIEETDDGLQHYLHLLTPLQFGEVPPILSTISLSPSQSPPQQSPNLTISTVMNFNMESENDNQIF